MGWYQKVPGLYLSWLNHSTNTTGHWRSLLPSLQSQYIVTLSTHVQFVHVILWPCVRTALPITMADTFKQHDYIKFCMKLDLSTTKTHEMLLQTSGEYSSGWTQIFQWHGHLKDGQVSVQDDKCSGWPIISNMPHPCRKPEHALFLLQTSFPLQQFILISALSFMRWLRTIQSSSLGSSQVMKCRFMKSSSPPVFSPCSPKWNWRDTTSTPVMASWWNCRQYWMAIRKRTSTVLLRSEWGNGIIAY